jgi:hypothetical protein
MSVLRLGLSILFAISLSVSSTHAQSVALPDLEGPVVLTVTGLDSTAFPDGKVELDVGRLQAIGTGEIETSSIWTEGVHRYSGVMLRDLVDFLDIGAATLRLHALNDYSVEFPVAEATGMAPILAYEMDGKAMSVREKGPVWVMYPFDDGADYRTDTTFSRSIWQLDRIDVLP